MAAETTSDQNDLEGEPLSTVPAPTNLQTISVDGKFTFRAPPDLAGGPLLGTDSLIGKYENANFEVAYDYGWYSSNAPSEGYQLSSVTVDGKPATLATKDGVVAVFIPNVQGMDGLSVVIKLKNNASAASATALITSIDFPV